MLNPFPILFLSMLAHAVLRVVTGGALVYLGLSNLRSARRTALVGALFGGTGSSILVWLAIISEFIFGSLLIVGFLTQFAALGAMVLSIAGLILSRRLRGIIPDPYFYLLLFAVSLSLFITGAGAFAFDLPI